MRRAELTALLAFAVACGSGASAFAQTPSAPQPAATTLPEIGRTHSRGLCTTVRDNVAPIVLGLMKSDELVGAGHRTFLKMGDDQRTGSREAIDLDQVYLRHATDAMAHNLTVIDKLLADGKRFPKSATTDDEHIAQDLKAQIQAVADRQRAALSTMANALDAEDLGRMQNDFPGGMAASTKPVALPAGAIANGARGPDTDGSFIGVSGLNMPQKNTPPPLARGTSNTKRPHRLGPARVRAGAASDRDRRRRAAPHADGRRDLDRLSRRALTGAQSVAVKRARPAISRGPRVDHSLDQ